MLNSLKRKTNTVLYSFITDLLRKTRQRLSITYDVIDELRRFSLSKYALALYHKLIYEIAIFHYINEETCDNIIY